MTMRTAATLEAASTADGVRLDRSVDIEAEVPQMWRIADIVRRVDGEIDRNTLDGMLAFYRNLDHCDPATDLVLARRGDELVGYARVEWNDSNDGERWYEAACFVHPGERRRGLGRRLLDWTEARRLELAAGHRAGGAVNGRATWLTTFAYDGDAGASALLRDAGYEPFRHFYSMQRPDLRDIPDLPLPAGLEIRPIPDEPDAIRALIAADNEAFLDHFGAVDDVETVYRQVVEDPDTDLDLWVVAFDGEEIAGAVINGIRPDHEGVRVGWCDSVFTRRPWRQRGLARALIARSLELLRDRGVPSASLGVDATNPNQALHLYESCGFRVVSSSTAYRKPVLREALEEVRR
jgi:mycothiol synthase